jgi:hypothetical protein
MMKKSQNSISDNEEIPDFVFSLFWEYEKGTINIFEHADLIIGRIMEIGTWDVMLWLRKTYPDKKLVSFLERKGRQILSPRELNYWAFITGIPIGQREKWTKESRERPDVWGARYAH